MSRRAVLADIRPLPVVPTVRPVERDSLPALVTEPTEADRHAWARAARVSMLQVDERTPRRGRSGWLAAAAWLSIVAALIALALIVDARKAGGGTAVHSLELRP